MEKKKRVWIKDVAGDGHPADCSPLSEPLTDETTQSALFTSVTLRSFSRGLLSLLSDEVREIKEDESESLEGLTSQQIFLWLQGLFLFALVWTVASTINSDGRKKFDLFFRNLIMGLDDSNPRPKSVRLTKNNTFPERGNLLPVVVAVLVVVLLSLFGA